MVACVAKATAIFDTLACSPSAVSVLVLVCVVDWLVFRASCSSTYVLSYLAAAAPVISDTCDLFASSVSTSVFVYVVC